MKLYSVLKSILVLMLLVGCVDQSVDVKNNSSGKDIDQSINIGGGVPLDLYEAKVEEAEKAKNKLEELEKDRSLDETARGILAVAEKAREEGDEEKYLAKIREYRKFLNKEPIKRAAESWELEGQVLFSQLRVEEAQKAIEEAIKLDSNNPEYLLTLADYLRWNGKYQRMEKVSIQVIALIENEENVDEKLLGGAYSYLGLAYLNGGKYDLANNYLQQALEMRKKGLGEKHPYVATSLNNLAALYESQGRYEEAEPMYLQALEMRKKGLGEKHPYVATSLNGHFAG